MFRLLSSSVLLTLLSFAISLYFLFIAKNAASFAAFALIQINQAYSASINSSLFFTPLFSNKKFRSIKFFRSQIFYSVGLNLVYSVIVFCFLYFSTSNYFLSLLAAVFVFISGLRIYFRSRLTFYHGTNQIALSDFILFFCSALFILISISNNHKSVEAVVFCLGLSCFFSFMYLLFLMRKSICRLFTNNQNVTYRMVLKESGFLYILISILSEFSSNFYAYFLSFKSGHESIALPSFSLMCFRPFNLSMTSFEEKLRIDIAKNRNRSINVIKRFFLVCLFVLISNYLIVLFISSTHLSESEIISVNFLSEDIFYFYNFFLIILFFRIIKQILLIDRQVKKMHKKIFVAYFLSFIFLCFSSVFFYESLDANNVMILMMISEIVICLGLFINNKYQFNLGHRHYVEK